MNYRKNIYILFALMVAAAGCIQSSNKGEAPTPVLLISFDGFRYDYLDKAPTPNFDSLLAEGVTSKGMIPVFPTKTFPNHYAIATGLYPEHNGLVANTMYDPEFDGWYRISDRDAVENPKWYGGEPIWNTVEKQGLKAGTMFWVGSEAPIQNMRPSYWKPYDSSMPFKSRIDTVVKWLGYPNDESVNFATLYFELVDHAGHENGVNSDSLKMAVQKADSLIGYLKKQLRGKGKWTSTNIIIVSDHGMTDLSADKTIMLDAIIDMDDIERIAWAPATMIQPKAGKTDSMYRALKEQENHYRVYRKEELPERYHLKENRRVPDLVVIADIGYTLMDNDYRDRFLRSLPAGTHGYDNREKEMQAFFAARGPDFKSGVTVSSFQNIHLYELMSNLLRIEPAPNDGSLDSVSVMLSE